MHIVMPFYGAATAPLLRTDLEKTIFLPRLSLDYAIVLERLMGVVDVPVGMIARCGPGTERSSSLFELAKKGDRTW